MRHKFTFLAVLMVLMSAKAQTNPFPYLKAWGTYVGGCGTYLYDQNQYGNGFHLDSQKNVYIGGRTALQAGYTDVYYNQYVNGGGNNVVMGQYNQYRAQFSPAGQMTKGSYTGTDLEGYKNLIGIDSNDFKYYIERKSGQVQNLATTGVWLSQVPTSSPDSFLLSKYDTSGNLVWQTYVPNPMNIYFTVKFDSDNNLYLMGKTTENISNLSTSGSFQENYFSVGPYEYTNSFLVKLNSSGQRLWATYIARTIFDFEVYQDGIYFLTLPSVNSVPGYTTSGTFQPSTFSKQLLCRLNTSDGLLTWGTYFGTTSTDSGDMANDIEINATGIYVSGLTSANLGSIYFATSGAYKTVLTGSSDFYLNKFDFTGNRIWGTYFGSDGTETINAFPNLALLGDRIVMTGKQYGFTNNIATAGAYITTPTNTSSTAINSFFVEFDSSGTRKYCSYFLERGYLTYNDAHSPVLLNDGSLIIWGSTGISANVGTAGAAFPTMINPFPGIPFGYIVKFILKDPLSTSEVSPYADIQLYDNPNDGDFYISGSILDKQKSSIKISDMSGRLVASQNLEKKKTNFIQMKGKLSAGNYLLEIASENGLKIKVFKLIITH